MPPRLTPGGSDRWKAAACSSNGRLPPPRTTNDIGSKSEARRRRSTFDGLDVGFPHGGLFQSQPFTTRFGSLPPPQFADSFRLFDSSFAGTVGGPLGGPSGLHQHNVDPVGRLGGFGDGLVDEPLQHDARGAITLSGAAPQSQVSYTNGAVRIATKIQHPTANNPQGQVLDAFDVHRLVTANGGRDRKKKPSKKSSHSHEREQSKDFSSSHAGDKESSLDYTNDRPPSTRYGAPKFTDEGSQSFSFSSGFVDNIQASDRFSSNSRRHNRPSSQFTPPKDYAAPPKKATYDPPSKRYGAPKLTDEGSQSFSGLNQEVGHQFPDRRQETGSSPFQNGFLGRIVVGDPHGAAPGGFPASQPLSAFAERASEDEVEEFFPGRTLADDIASGAPLSRLQAPSHPRPRPATQSVFDLTSTDGVPKHPEPARRRVGRTSRSDQRNPKTS